MNLKSSSFTSNQNTSARSTFRQRSCHLFGTNPKINFLISICCFVVKSFLLKSSDFKKRFWLANKSAWFDTVGANFLVSLLRDCNTQYFFYLQHDNIHVISEVEPQLSQRKYGHLWSWSFFRYCFSCRNANNKKLLKNASWFIKN